MLPFFLFSPPPNELTVDMPQIFLLVVRGTPAYFLLPATLFGTLHQLTDVGIYASKALSDQVGCCGIAFQYLIYSR